LLLKARDAPLRPLDLTREVVHSRLQVVDPEPLAEDRAQLRELCHRRLDALDRDAQDDVRRADAAARRVVGERRDVAAERRGDPLRLLRRLREPVQVLDPELQLGLVALHAARIGGDGATRRRCDRRGCGSLRGCLLCAVLRYARRLPLKLGSDRRNAGGRLVLASGDAVAREPDHRRRGDRQDRRGGGDEHEPAPLRPTPFESLEKGAARRLCSCQHADALTQLRTRGRLRRAQLSHQ
jgi:hypothetical protein